MARQHRKSVVGSNPVAARRMQHLLTMKITSKSNGTLAAGTQVVASRPSVSDNPAQTQAALHNIPLSHFPPKRMQTSPTEEEAFRRFLLNRLPDVKAPQSLRDKIKGLVKNSHL